MKIYDVVVIGGGAAGLMCAAMAGKKGKSVVVLDHANKVGKKILMSGGGRCNFTNYFIEPGNFISNNPHFCKSALSRYTQYDFLALVAQYDLQFHEKTAGQLFCDNKAKDILNILLNECENAKVEILTSCDIAKVETETEEPSRFKINSSLGGFRCRSLVVATGGLSIPTMGATGLGYDLAKQFGLKLTRRVASLVPFIFKGPLQTVFASLSGVALPVCVEANGVQFKEALLFTHRGLSGPAVLQISNYWNEGDSLQVDFLPEQSLLECIDGWVKAGEKSTLKNLLALHLPKKFVEQWLAHHIPDISSKTVFALSNKEKNALAQIFHQWSCVPDGTEGYRTAEVTKGGIDTDEVSSKTFEAKKVPGLFFIGEVLDVTGWLGGFNFQWAWSSAYCAAEYV